MSQWQEIMKSSLSSNLPNEIVFDILSRLPVKSIVQFKCVCKPWCTLFGDPKFIEVHLNRAIANNIDCFLLQHLSNSEEEIYPLRRNEIYSLRSNETFEEFGKLQAPVQIQTQEYQIVEASHGLLCLTESIEKGSFLGLNTFLWNPAIREFTTLPKYHINRSTSPHNVVALGFAFHPKINDYKVVRIVYLNESETSEVEVYSLSTECWTKVEANIQCHINSNLSRAFLNGAVHWMAAKKDEMENNHDMILSFDMGEDEFNEMMLPDFGWNGYISDKTLAMFKGSLCVFHYDPFHLSGNCAIWVMKEYGVAGSWAKQFTILREVEFMIPLGFFVNGEVMLEKYNEELVLCDPKVKKIRNLHVFGPARIVKYMETLVSTKGRK